MVVVGGEEVETEGRGADNEGERMECQDLTVAIGVVVYGGEEGLEYAAEHIAGSCGVKQVRFGDCYPAVQ